jgi:hypothetical protein
MQYQDCCRIMIGPSDGLVSLLFCRQPSLVFGPALHSRKSYKIIQQMTVTVVEIRDNWLYKQNNNLLKKKAKS